MLESSSLGSKSSSATFWLFDLGQVPQHFVSQFPHLQNGNTTANNNDSYFTWILQGPHELILVKLTLYGSESF